ncbi:MAG: protein kinase [Armatimonadota bacterium]
MAVVGQVINFRYEILEKTGEGNFFTVYRTRDKVMNRLIAVKVLKPEFAADSELSTKIVTRARLLVPMSHPNIAKVYEAEVGQDATYIAEEHVRGIDLKERIRRIAPFTVSAAVDVSVAVAQGLECLHKNGIVHGDLRPQKVLMGPEGEVKLTGAGVALALADQPDRRSLALMRSAHYAAPELFENDRPNDRTDIYALGVVLYEMLTGALPYEAETPIAVAMCHARDPIPSARTLNAGVPRAVDGIIQKALSKSPEGRYQSMTAMIADLRNAQESMRIGKPLSWSPQDPVQEVAVTSETEIAEESVWKFLGKGLLLLAVVALIVGVAFAMLFKTGPASVNVPSIVGRSVEEARTKLEDVELVMVVDREEFNEKYPEGQVYYTTPREGEPVRTNSTVNVYISKGARFLKVPAVTGMSESRAMQVLKDAGFITGDVTQEYTPSVPMGNIVRQRPRAETRAERNSVVDLTTSLGVDPATIAPPVEDPIPQTDSSDQSSSDTAGSERKLNIRFLVPEGPARKVDINVKDDNGERIELSNTYSGGDEVSTTITVVGKRVEIRTYLDGREVNKQIK